MDQSIVESPNVTTVGETGCSVTAGPSGATTENNGVVNYDVEDAVAGRDADNDSDGETGSCRCMDNTKVQKHKDDDCSKAADNGSEIDCEIVEGDDAGPSNVGYGAAAGPSNAVIDAPWYETTDYAEMSTSQCDNDCIFYAAERGVLCKHGARFCGQCQRMTFQDVCTCSYYYY